MAVTEKPGSTEYSVVKLELEAVFREHAAYVWQTLRRLGVRAADLEDASHDVFLVVHKHLSAFDSTRPIKPWLYGIALRVALRHRGRAVHRREQGGEDGRDAASTTPGPDAQVESDQQRALLLKALDCVDPARRHVLILHDLDGVSMPDITEALKIPLNTGYSRLRLARGELQAALRALGADRGKS